MSDPDPRTNVAAAIRSASRMIAAAMVILAGGIAVGTAPMRDSGPPATGEGVGIVLILVGALFFLIEYVVSYRGRNPPPGA